MARFADFTLAELELLRLVILLANEDGRALLNELYPVLEAARENS